jgi:magnesium chelatase subunit I
MMRAYPFSAIVGQEEMKRALLIAAVDPKIGGVMVFGDRGTGKSTAVRALGQLLPPVKVVPSCPFNCLPDRSPCPVPCARKAGRRAVAEAPVPFVDLPLGATEDRVLGSLDLEAALTTGEKRFEPGLLARAHRGYLYVDEVNLLEDHIVDLLLDVAVSGECIIEREGLSVRHAARFQLIGSGNPEEGELRPQLLDRFALSVEVRTPQAIGERIEIVRRRDAFDRDPEAFIAAWAASDTAIMRSILRARRRLPSIAVADSVLELGARLCSELGADGLRGELTLMRAARALAALGRAPDVGEGDVAAVAPMALRHRLRRNPLDETGSGARIERALAALGAA